MAETRDLHMYVCMYVGTMFCFFNIFAANAFIYPFNTQTMHTYYVSHFVHNNTAMFP
jgi:hypothetical protein